MPECAKCRTPFIERTRGKNLYCSRRCAVTSNRADPSTLPQCRILGNRYEVDGDVATIIIDRGDHEPVRVSVDAADVPVLSAWTWRINTVHMRVVGRRSGDRSTYHLPRVLMGCPGGMFVDHINGDPLDNRRENLRVVTAQQNAQNHMNGYGSRSMPRGVHIARRGRNGKNVYFKVEHKLHGRNICAGYFKTAEEADAAAKRWRAEHMPFSAEGDGRVSVANA